MRFKIALTIFLMMHFNVVFMSSKSKNQEMNEFSRIYFTYHPSGGVWGLGCYVADEEALVGRRICDIGCNALADCKFYEDQKYLNNYLGYHCENHECFSGSCANDTFQAVKTLCNGCLYQNGIYCAVACKAIPIANGNLKPSCSLAISANCKKLLLENFPVSNKFIPNPCAMK